MNRDSDTYRTPLSDLLHEILCRSGHQMDQCGYGWAPYDNYRETRLWVERAELLRDSLPQLTEEQLIEVLSEIKEIANFNFYNDPKNREVTGPARYKKQGNRITKMES